MSALPPSPTLPTVLLRRGKVDLVIVAPKRLWLAVRLALHLAPPRPTLGLLMGHNRVSGKNRQRFVGH